MTYEEFLENTKDRAGDWILTKSSIPFWPLDPRPDEVNIEDIAWALSQINRYTGHTFSPYSVGQHSLILSQIVSPQNALWALLHDAPEAYLTDISGPVKQFLPEFKLWESKLMVAICSKFGLPPVEPVEVNTADKKIVRNEMETYMPDFPFEYPWQFDRLPISMFINRYMNYSPMAIYLIFMDRFSWLTTGKGKDIENKYPNPFYPETLVRKYF